MVSVRFSHYICPTLNPNQKSQIMNPTVDSIHIHFSTNNLYVLNACLALLMFSIALEIKFDNFKTLAQQPKAVIIGLISQLIIAPLLTLLLVFIFQPAPSVGLGMIAISACPGGNNSIFCTHLAKGNTALSVTTTTISVLASMLTLPLYLLLGAQVTHIDKNMPGVVVLNFGDVFSIIFWLIIVPLCLGMFIGSLKSAFVQKLIKPFKIISQLLFFSLIIGGVASNFENIKNYLQYVFGIVAVLNVVMLATGYFFAKLNKLTESDARALAFETGIHNVTIALIIIFNFFNGLGGMALIAAWYGIWDLITGFTLATFWQKKQVSKGILA